MTFLALFFAGSVLFVNGLALLGRVEPRSAAPITLLVGSLIVATALYNLFPARDLTATDNLTVVISMTGFMVFGFAYLYVGIVNLTGSPGNGAGWFCAWAALVSAGLALVNFARFGDARFGTLWVLWTILFTLFFLVLALDMERLAWLTGWVTLIEAFVTATIPAALLMLGWWESVPQWATVATGLFCIAVFGLLALRSPPGAGRSADAEAPRRPAVETTTKGEVRART